VLFEPRRARVASLVVVLFLLGCSRPYRVGDYVLVEWGDENHLYPAYVVQKKGTTRFRVHFDGYPARFDEDVTLDRVKGLVQGTPSAPPPPHHVRIATGLDKKTTETPTLSHYKVGDHLKVRFRGSIYRATVLKVLSSDRLEIHYDGHESVWDEVISADRIAPGQ
jgi:hypothetical protein